MVDWRTKASGSSLTLHTGPYSPTWALWWLAADRRSTSSTVTGAQIPAPTARSARGVDVEPATQNPQPAFLVRVSVDRADGIAERRDGKLSVMTHFLADKILASSTLTLEQGYQHVLVEVPKYMQSNFPGREQTPQLVPAQGGKKVNLR
jgi:hypothetical protein